MKRTGIFLCTAFLLFSLTACSSSQQNTQSENSKPSVSEEQISAETNQHSQTDTAGQTNTNTQPEEISQSEEEKETEYMLNIQIGEKTLTAALEHNSSAEALLELLSKGPLTLQMSDYGGMEKTAALPEKLPENNKSIQTDAGDLILYQGNIITIYYDTNSWSLTRLGKINDITKSELQSILGKGDVTVTFSAAS